MLFSERYKEFVQCKDGIYKDFVCGHIEENVKAAIESVMYEFTEPNIVYPDRYSNFNVTTDALLIAVDEFNKRKGKSYISLTSNDKEAEFKFLREIFTPFLFDLIELQYEVLSDSEGNEFEIEINKIFDYNEIPWILHSGKMIKIDSQQFEYDLKQKQLVKLKELTYLVPVFQSAYEEFIKGIEFFQRGDYAEAVTNAEKSYESVMKVILQANQGTAEQLTKNLTKRQILDIPETMADDGFKEKVLMSLPYIRNKSTASHGAGSSTVRICKNMANLAINLAATLNSYLIDEFRRQM